jgi:hypothetical protein
MNIFNIHKQTTSKEDKKKLIKIIRKQNRIVIKNSFKMTCGCCEKITPVEWLYKCFYCGVWFCHKCAEDHFSSEKEIILKTIKKCSGCSDCKALRK